jgi:hypothetical protein
MLRKLLLLLPPALLLLATSAPARAQTTFNIPSPPYPAIPSTINAVQENDLAHTPAGDPAQEDAAYPTTTTLSCSVDGQTTVPLLTSIPLLATVTSAYATPTGSINFLQGENNLTKGQLTAAGTVGTYGTALEPDNVFTANYIADIPFADSSATCDVKVLTQSLSIASSNNPSPAYIPITFTAANAVVPVPSGTYVLAIVGPATSQTVPMNPSLDGRSAIYTNPGLAQGNYTVTATFSPADGRDPYTASIAGGQRVNAPIGDFNLTGPGAFTIPAEGVATGTLTLTSIAGFSGLVFLSCNLPLPTTYTCTLNPTSLPLAINAVSDATITLGPTNVRAAEIPHSRGSCIALATLLPLTLLCLTNLRRRRSMLRSFLCFTTLALLAATTACGKDIFYATTQPGTYPLTITATGTTKGGTAPSTHILPIHLVITP